MSQRKAIRAATLLESGVRQFRQGQIEQARASFEEALKLSPGHPDALHFLGIVELQAGRPADAVARLQPAVAKRPDNPDYLANLAYAYVGIKRLPEALAAFERAARLNPDDPEIQLGIGNCLGMSGRAADAEAVLRRLVERHPRNALAWFNLAKAVDEQKRYEEACELYARAVQIAPRYAEAYNNLGVALNRLERAEEAERAFRTCLALRPDFATARVNLAISLNHLRRSAEAEALCRQALSQDPQQAGARAMLGLAVSGQGRWREASQYFAEALKEEPENPELLGYLGHALARCGRTPEALTVFRRALAREPAPRDVRFNMAIALLDAGRISEGMAEYFPRKDNLLFLARHPDRSLTTKLPEDLRGREICLVREQGIGDEIFFLRYAPLLKARGCRVTYHGSRKIISILARSNVLDRTLPDAEPYASADHTIFVGDLPLFLGSLESSPWHPPKKAPGNGSSAGRFSEYVRVYWPELPPPLPLEPLPDRVASIVGRLGRIGPPPYIALTWRSGTDPRVQQRKIVQLFKELPIDPLAARLATISGTLLSVQRNPKEGETERLAARLARPVHDFSASNEDLEEMLALLAVVDEYVGVSNTNMHLRASVGRAARVLVPWPAEWRWLLSGDESPWFPGFRIYRQRPDGDWTAALERLGRDMLTAGSDTDQATRAAR